MKTIGKKNIGIMLIVVVVFFGWGVCTAEEPPILGEAIPIAPFGVIDTTAPTFEWTSVPGATTYCLLIEDIEGAPVYLAWYTDEEAGCTAAESEVCAVTPSHIVHGDVWSVLFCMEGDCGQWSNPTPFGIAEQSTTQSEMRQVPGSPQPRNCPQQQLYLKCRDTCIVTGKACRKDCDKKYPSHNLNTMLGHNRHVCDRNCIINASQCNRNCFRPYRLNFIFCVKQQPISIKDVAP